MPPRKKKRSLDKEYASFPDEVFLGSKISDAGAARTSSVVSNAWLRCGDGFARSSTRTASGSCERMPSAFQVQPFPSAEGEDQQLIDWEKDSERASEDGNTEGSHSGKAESAVQISDSDSCPSSVSLSLVEQEATSSKAIPTDISEYSSDSDKEEDGGRVEAESLRLGSVQKQMLIYGTDPGQAAGKSASDWLKSAQALLQTPEKRPGTSSKTPEDSAKKRKRFLRGGLAERLNRLQNRERSAVSFWRHQCVADYKTPSGSRSGVLMVKILKVHEECSMQVALCEQLGAFPVESLPVDSPSDSKLKVLFSKETAAHLKAAPQDIIHIHPPWQKLSLHNENFPVVLNTHFSQKVFSDAKEEMKGKAPIPGKAPTRRSIVSLSQIFKLNNPEETSQVTCLNVAAPKTTVTHETLGKHLLPSHTVSDSLLDVVETQGAAGWRSVHVRVVVQRIYCLLARDGAGCHLQGKTTALYPPALNTAPSNIRLCLLVQDGYGIFSELQLHSACPSPEDLELREKEWEGKTCCLTGVKILQRTTRGRAPGLFNLIDSLWPPLTPIKIHGQSQDKMEIKPSVPAPSFCYILAALPDQGSVDFSEDSELCELYLPPVLHSLRQILQVVGLTERCSFCATVVYRRSQAKSNPQLGQCESWLFVTDMDLQGSDMSGTGVGKAPKVLPVVVAPSCVLSNSVTQTLAGARPCVLFFKDAVREDGRIICVERTVLSAQKPPLCPATAVDLSELPGPVKLDELDSSTLPNSLCRVQGIIVGVDEARALSWKACGRCDNDTLEESYPARSLYCRRCSQAVTSPVHKRQLEVFLQCPSMAGGTVKVKLKQETIASLLGSPPSTDGSYELASVLGKEVGPLNCYLLAAANHHACSRAALEEVDLLEAGRK
ncbi:DNA repair-scaffolding protein isoform X2 [Ambystoma mexicanum]|uniref:DNA repair-scaffolding protein isoform X2 n=1 Tax=Ambystoma mexicanum TaxID=8296 RepID=UPI0037E9C327